MKISTLVSFEPLHFHFWENGLRNQVAEVIKYPQGAESTRFSNLQGSYGFLMQAMSTAQKAGATNIGLMADPEALNN